MSLLFVLSFLSTFCVVCPRANAHIVASICTFARDHTRVRRPPNTRVYKYKFAKTATLFYPFTQARLHQCSGLPALLAQPIHHCRGQGAGRALGHQGACRGVQAAHPAEQSLHPAHRLRRLPQAEPHAPQSRLMRHCSAFLLLSVSVSFRHSRRCSAFLLLSVSVSFRHSRRCSAEHHSSSHRCSAITFIATKR